MTVDPLAMLPGEALARMAEGAYPADVERSIPGRALAPQSVKATANAIQTGLPESIRSKLTPQERRALVLAVLRAIGIPTEALTTPDDHLPEAML